MAHSTTINGFLCELEPHADRDGLNCYVSAGRFSASLECLHDTEALTDTSDAEMAVSRSTIDKITTWAQANGY